MIDFKAGDVVIVPFPFTDLKTAKKRPALVLASIESKSLPSLAIVSMITSQIESETIRGDVLVSRWKEAGLLHPSKVRLSKLATLEESVLQNRLGALEPGDKKAVREELEGIFSDF